jgi:raffinose/stachyose/melibiose transport system permease protein
MAIHREEREMTDSLKRLYHVRDVGDLVFKLTSYVVLTAAVIVTIYPIIWMIFDSLKSDDEFYTNIWGPPKAPLLSNYLEAWVTGGIGRYFLNSVIVTGATIIVVLTFTSLSAYAFARLEFPGSNLLFLFFLISLMVPQAVLTIPIFTVVSQLGLANTRLSMILVYSAGSIAFGTFILRAYFISIPHELEEAAMIDGCTPIGAFFRVILPLARPGLATQLIFTGLGTWNEYFIGSILVRTQDLRTLPIGLVGFVERYTTHYPQYFSALVIITLPVIILYILGQKQFQSGLTAGAVKA